MHLPENVKFFIWQLCHKALPTKSFMVHHHIPILASSLRCRLGEEDLHHIFWECGSIVYLKGRVVGFALWKENCSNIFCVSDSLHAVQLIKQQVQGCHAYAAIVEHIRDFLEGGVEAFSASVQMP
ncbi:hypothetical protein GYH30_042309 [Glycine max]|nr:hypothetical protein GYH30_042309 [Glycine max]